MPISYTGKVPGPSGNTPAADGRAPEAPADMSAACEQAAGAALAHAESEGRKIAMGVQPPAST